MIAATAGLGQPYLARRPSPCLLLSRIPNDGKVANRAQVAGWYGKGCADASLMKFAHIWLSDIRISTSGNCWGSRHAPTS